MPHSSDSDEQMFGARQQIPHDRQSDQQAEKFTSSSAMAAKNKCLAESNKSLCRGQSD
jgi:hypothetical protein